MTTSTMQNTTDREAAVTDPRPQFAAAVRIAAPVIAGTRPNQLHLDSPCVELDVEGLLDHLVFVLRRVAKLCRGQEAFAPGSFDQPADQQHDWPAQWQAGSIDVEAAFADDAVLGRTIVLPWATMTGGEMLQMYTAEITAHTWDLATATEQSAQWDDDVCRVALDAMHRDLPMADRTPMWEAFRATMPANVQFDPPFANAVAVGPGATLIDQLVAWLGRRP